MNLLTHSVSRVVLLVGCSALPGGSHGLSVISADVEEAFPESGDLEYTPEHDVWLNNSVADPEVKFLLPYDEKEMLSSPVGLCLEMQEALAATGWEVSGRGECDPGEDVGSLRGYTFYAEKAYPASDEHPASLPASRAASTSGRSSQRASRSGSTTDPTTTPVLQPRAVSSGGSERSRCSRSPALKIKRPFSWSKEVRSRLLRSLAPRE